jgi:NADH-quinone oxidoreductase subunit L
MTLPLALLALLATAGGALNLPFSSDLHFLGHWLEPSLFGNEAEVGSAAGTKWVLAAAAAAVALAAVAVAYAVYARGRARPELLERDVLAHAWYVDDGYARFVAGPGRKLFDLAAWFDRAGVASG